MISGDELKNRNELDSFFLRGIYSSCPLTFYQTVHLL